jgi:hypothetical protein
MGFFFKALAAIVAADAIDRHARSRPIKYWYPNQPGLPTSGGQRSCAVMEPPMVSPAPRPPACWDLEHPERPCGASERR